MLFPRNVFGQPLFFGWWVVVAIDLRTDFNGRHITRVECWTQSKLAVFFSKARHTKPFAKVRHKGGGTLPPESAFLWNKNGIYTQGHVENKIQFKFQVCVCIKRQMECAFINLPRLAVLECYSSPFLYFQI